MAKKKAANVSKRGSPPSKRPAPRVGTRGGTPNKKTNRKKRSPESEKTVPYPEQTEGSVIRVLAPSADVLFARARLALKEILSKVRKDPLSHFVDIGYKFTNGEVQPDIAIRLHVSEKQNADPIPKTCCDGQIRTDVITTGFIVAASEIDAGDSLASDGGAGTLAMGVRMPGGNANTQWMFLTCAHVATTSQAISPGVHPSFRDSAGDLIGTLFNASSTYFENSSEYDVAIFPSANTIPPSERGKFDNYPVRPRAVADPTAEDVINRTVVYKYGGATGLTTGVIDSNGVLFGDIPLDNGLLATDHFLVRSSAPAPFAIKGDSGSAVLSADGRLLGMIRAVTQEGAGNARAVVTKMSSIQARFGFDIRQD